MGTVAKTSTVAALAVLLSLAACGSTAAPSSTATSATTTIASATTTSLAPTTTVAPTTTTLPKPTTTTKPPAPIVLQNESGNGMQSEPQFTVPSTASGWTLAYSFNCSNFGSQGNFAIYITGSGAAAGSTDAGPNELAESGASTDSYYDTGTFQFEVNSECDWTYKVSTTPS